MSRTDHLYSIHPYQDDEEDWIQEALHIDYLLNFLDPPPPCGFLATKKFVD